MVFSVNIEFAFPRSTRFIIARSLGFCERETMNRGMKIAEVSASHLNHFTLLCYYNHCNTPNWRRRNGLRVMSMAIDPTGPLGDVRVLDASRVLAGPVCGQVLRGLGA